MKKLIEKIRRWMIRKLGGFTVQNVTVPIPAQYVNLNFVTLKVERKLRTEELLRMEPIGCLIPITKQNMINELMQEIQAPGILQWQESQEHDGVKYRVALRVVPLAEMERVRRC